MELTLITLHRRILKRFASLFLVLSVCTILSSCFLSRERMAHNQANCQGYSINYLPNNVSNSLYIHGKIKFCHNGKTAKYSEVTLTTSSGQVYTTTSDKKGLYSFVLDRNILDAHLDVRHTEGRLITASIFLGYANDCELNLRLRNTNSFTNEIELTPNDIRNIKKKITEKKI